MPPKLKYFSMCMQSATDTARIQLEYTLDTDDAQSQDNCTKMTTSAALLHFTGDGKVLVRRKTMEDGGVHTPGPWLVLVLGLAKIRRSQIRST